MRLTTKWYVKKIGVNQQSKTTVNYDYEKVIE